MKPQAVFVDQHTPLAARIARRELSKRAWCVACTCIWLGLIGAYVAILAYVFVSLISIYIKVAS